MSLVQDAALRAVVTLGQCATHQRPLVERASMRAPSLQAELLVRYLERRVWPASCIGASEVQWRTKANHPSKCPTNEQRSRRSRSPGQRAPRTARTEAGSKKRGAKDQMQGSTCTGARSGIRGRRPRYRGPKSSNERSGPVNYMRVQVTVSVMVLAPLLPVATIVFAPVRSATPVQLNTWSAEVPAATATPFTSSETESRLV